MAHSLAENTWVEVPKGAVVLVPLGSLEQHGPHLPFGTDSIIARVTAKVAAPRIEIILGTPVLVAPVLAFGASGEHQGFPGTISIGHEALRLVLIEMIRSISTWAARIVLLNGHGGNLPTAQEVADQMQGEGHNVSLVNCAVESPADAHAGLDETSMIMHLAPDHVRQERIEPGNTRDLADVLPDLMAHGVRHVSHNGILGDPTTATRQMGAEKFTQMVTRVVREVTHG